MAKGAGSTPAALWPRLVCLAAGAACLLAGLDAALLRLGLPSPVSGAELAALHGPLMLVGFLGTVISLERAVAARTTWAFAAPGASAAGSLLLLAGVPDAVGRGLVTAGSLALCAIYVRVHRRAPSVAGDVEALGAAALTLGNVQWCAGLDITAAVPLWLLFPVLTIIGERLELARVAFLGDAVEGTVRGLSVTALLGACLLPVTDLARLLTGPALLALAVVMAFYDVARRTVRSSGGVRFMAASMLAGYVWLAVGGAAWTLSSIAGGTGSGYDIVIHCLALGFAFSMILAHAPTIVPALVHRRLPYHRAMWLPYLLLHAGLAVRVAGLLAGAGGTWQTGGTLGVSAILLFLIVVLARVATSGSIGAPGPRPRRRRARATATVPAPVPATVPTVAPSAASAPSAATAPSATTSDPSTRES